MTAETETALFKEISSVEKNSGSTADGAGEGRMGATTIAWRGVRAVQQFVWAVLPDVDAGAQQLCAGLRVLCRQVPRGASIVPINTMATVARCTNPLCMRAVYHLFSFMG